MTWTVLIAAFGCLVAAIWLDGRRMYRQEQSMWLPQDRKIRVIEHRPYDQDEEV